MNEYYELMESAIVSYPKTVHKLDIGTSVKNNPLSAFILMSIGPDVNFDAEVRKRNSILLTGAHHAREMTTVSQTVFQMLWILFKLEA